MRQTVRRQMIRTICMGVFMMNMILMTAGCASPEGTDNDAQTPNSYECISQEDAKKLMESEENYIILDVRTPEEYASGHIVNAICIPNETITTIPPVELPDKNQLILVYCRSGNRSKQASEKLAKMGYTNIKEFGGINTWDGDIE